jgi:hypothetical protein
LSGESVDLVEGERGIEWLRERRLLELGSDVGVVAGLNSEDGAGCVQVVGVGNGSSGTEVGADSDTLENGCESNEGGWVGGWEGVDALCDGLVTESLGEERDMGGLIVGDFLEVGVEWVGETGLDEVLLGVVGKTLTVELVLELHEGQGVVEDVNVGNGGGELDDWASRCNCGESSDGE